MSRCFACFVATSLLAISNSVSWAQNGVLAELYGAGVHRFNAGDFLGAEQLLNRVVAEGSQDARAYYFLGLAKYQSGNHIEAESMFEEAARVETQGKGNFDVGQALQRVQGAVRSKIEIARRDARATARQQMLLLQQAKMQEAQKAGVAVDPNAVPSAEVTQSDPFGAGSGMRSDETADAPAAASNDFAPANEPPADTINPFEDDPATSTQPSANPFDAGANPFENTEPEPAPIENPFNF
ncbi:MAG: tetratricopeptide repeat protein [Planctomycetales bacterium]|nr:tetratricopeptide repeat protein [Planctomycetales bacterium]